MDEGNNNGSFIPMEELPRYNINTAISLHIFGLYVKFNFNRRGISLSRREMRYEFVRYITFYDSPRSLRDIRDFVKAGFYYSQDRDIVVCYCCGYCRGNWHIAEVPLDIHQRFSPNCIFFDANVTVDIPYNLFPGRCERFFTYSASEHNTQGPSSFSTRTARGEVRLPRVHGVRPVIFEQVEMHEHIPFANLPMRQDVLATTFGPNNPLVYLEGVQIRRIDSISTSQESEFPTYMDVEHMSANQRMIMLHNRSVPRVDYTNYSGSSVAGFHYYHRNLRNTFMEHDNGTFATNGPREELDEEHDYTVNTTPEVRHVQGVQINDSHENETNETERKTIHQAETNHKSEFVINGSKENISPKIIPAQYLTKLANDTSRLQVNISSSCMHPSNISELEENVDVEDVLSEATTNDLDNENYIRDQSIEQIAPVIDETDISVSACKEECASSDLSTSTISRRRKLENVRNVYQHSRNLTNMDSASDNQLCGESPDTRINDHGGEVLDTNSVSCQKQVDFSVNSGCGNVRLDQECPQTFRKHVFISEGHTPSLTSKPSVSDINLEPLYNKACVAAVKSTPVSDIQSQNGQSATTVPLEESVHPNAYQTDDKGTGENVTENVNSYTDIKGNGEGQVNPEMIQMKPDQKLHVKHQTEQEVYKRDINESLESKTTAGNQHYIPRTDNESKQVHSKKEQAGCHTLQDESEQKSHVHPSTEQEKHKKDVRGRTATVVSLENKSNEKNQHRLPWMTNDAKQTDPNKKDAVKEQAGEDVPAGKDNVFKNCHWLTPNQSVDEGEKKNNVKSDSGPLAHSKISEKEESVKPVITERAQAGHTVTTSKTYLSSSTTSKLEQEISNKMDNVEGKLKTAVEQDHNNRLHCSDTRSQNGESNSKVQVEGCTCSDTYQTDRRLSGENKAADVDSFISVTRTDKEQAGSQTVQDKSDQESHAQPPAELEKCETNDHRRTGIESSLESNTTVKIQHPATCTANDSYHTYQNKEAFTGMNVVSQRSQSGVISQTDRPVNSADHYNTDQTSDDNPSRAAKHIVQKEEEISAAKSREMTVNQSAEINMMPMLTNVICNERERNIELFPSSEECAASTSEHSGSQTIQDKSDQESHVQPPAELENYEANDHEQTGTEASLEDNTIVKFQHPASCTANDSYHMNQNKEGSQTVQDKSDQESHAQLPAELEKYETNGHGRTGTESSLEDNTIERIQHPATCTANDSYHANQNKEAFTGMNVVSQRSQSGVILQTGRHLNSADHYKTDQTSDDDTNHGKSQIVNHTNTANPSQAAKHIVKKEEGISAAKRREMTVNQSTKMCVMPMPTNAIGNKRERNIEVFPSSEVCAANSSAKQRTGTVTRHGDKEIIIDLGAVTSEKDHRRGPIDQQSQKSTQQSQNILPKTDVSCGKTSCQDIQDKKKTSLPTKLVEEKQSQRHVRRCRSCSESDKQTKRVSDSCSESVSPDNATKIGKKRHVIAQENGAKTCQQTKAGPQFVTVNKDILVSEEQKLSLNEAHINGTDDNKSHITKDTASDFNVDMRSHNEASIHNETDQAAEPKSDEHVAHTTVRLPNDRIHDRVVPLSSHKERNSPTGITVGETQKTKGKPKAFSPTDDSCIINKENVDGLKHELPDNDELLFATNIANEITKIKDPKRRNDVMMQCIHMIHEAQTQERSIEKKQNEVRPSPSRTLSNECFATEEE